MRSTAKDWKLPDELRRQQAPSFWRLIPSHAWSAVPESLGLNELSTSLSKRWSNARNFVNLSWWARRLQSHILLIRERIALLVLRIARSMPWQLRRKISLRRWERWRRSCPLIAKGGL